MAEAKEIVKARREVRTKQTQYWETLAVEGRSARMAAGQSASAGQSTSDNEESRRRTARHSAAATAGAAGLAIATIAGSASAQDIGRLERMSAERNAAIHSPQQTPSPAGPTTPLAKPSQHLTCMSTTPWQPVFAQPNGEATTLGKTQPQIAATGRTINGYAEVTYYNGQTGYVPSALVHPFQSQVKPGGTCSIAGVRQNGAPVFKMG